MNTDRIAYFLAVVREGSFSAAAKNMYVSQTAISQQIASLEKEMGCALFHRLSTGAVLTDQGEQFLPYAERLMGIQLELQDAFADAHRVSAIHIGYNGPLEKELIVDAYLSLHPHLPNLVIHPLYLSLTAMSDALYRGQCDMVLTLPGEIDQRNTYQEVLYDVPMIAAVSEASPLAEKSTRKWTAGQARFGRSASRTRASCPSTRTTLISLMTGNTGSVILCWMKLSSKYGRK